mmetsp:Transcript_1629/g.4997  ORF Transcript_1629/g.4997 Transcript_1629/m.4997 type:complete len:440 (-) Transcript_1629:17-1336(-)
MLHGGCRISAAEAAIDAWVSCKPQGYVLDESRLPELLPLIVSKVPHTEPGCHSKELAELFVDGDGDTPVFVTLLKVNCGQVHFLNFWKAFGKAVHLSEATSEDGLFAELETLRDRLLRILEEEGGSYESLQQAALPTSALVEEVHRAASMSAQPGFWGQVAASLAQPLEFSALHLDQLSSLLLLWLNDSATWEQMHATASRVSSPLSESQYFSPLKDAWNLTSIFSSFASVSSPSHSLTAAADSTTLMGHMVYVHVYDVSQAEQVQKLNRILAHKHAPLKLGGVFHAGVEVNGVEWSFAYQPYETRYGVGCHSPKMHPQHHFRQTVGMGRTQCQSEKITELLACMVEEYPGGDYDLLRRNCCHFADDLCQRLGVGPIPGWIYRLARVGAGVAAMLEAAQSIGSRVSVAKHNLSQTLQAPECRPTRETLHKLQETEWTEW